MNYSEPVRDILKAAKKAAALSKPDCIEPKAAVISWEDVAAAACGVSAFGKALSGLLNVESPNLLWPNDTEARAAEIKDAPTVEVPLRPTPELDHVFLAVKGGKRDVQLEISDLAHALWTAASLEWRKEFCERNGLELEKLTTNVVTSAASTAQQPLDLLATIKHNQGIYDAIRQKVYGQDAALREVSNAIFKAAVTTNRAEDTCAPGVVFLFMGPPGCGKTYTAEVLSKHLKGRTGKDRPLCILDMSSYATHESALHALTGFPPSYVNSKAGDLTGFVNSNPHALLVFDEVEKAHPEALRLLLQVLGRGMLRDNHLRKDVPFRDTVIVLTTNAGKSLYDNVNRTGLTFDMARVHTDTILDALEKEKNAQGETLFPRELCSRLAGGYPILFRPLQPLAYDQVIKQSLAAGKTAYWEQFGVDLVCDDPLVRTLLVLRSGPDLDARRVKDSVGRFVSEYLVEGYQHYGQVFENAYAQGARSIVLRVPESGRGAEIIEKIEKSCRRILLVDDREEFLELFRTACPDFTWIGACDAKSACEAVRREAPDWVLQDLDLRGTVEGPLDTEGGMECLRVLHEQFPDLPVFILSRALSTEHFNEDLYRRCIEAGGARGYVDRTYVDKKQTDEVESFRKGLEDIRNNLAREALIREMVRSRKRVVFDTEFRLHKLSNAIHCNLHSIRFEVVPTSAGFGMFSVTRPNTRFRDVAGCEEARKQLETIVLWLKNPTAFQQLGATMRRGVLMVGPPGTGKTFLASAVAGEADAMFLPAKASEFISGWQASGAKAIRELFAEARRHAPAIVFIDEIDAIGGARDTHAGRDAEHRQALIQLLTELDGFGRNDTVPVVVLAATNRPSDLDPALCRPGRFDCTVEVGLPDQRAREEMLRLFAQNKRVEGVDLSRVAQRTGGFSPADLRELVNDALIRATLARRPAAGNEDFNDALNRMRFGSEGRREISEQHRRMTAAHEAGHAVVSMVLLPEQPLPQISILPRPGYGMAGFVETREVEEQRSLPDSRFFRNRLAILLAGRAAEEQQGQLPSVGAESDLERATRLAHDMVMRWGLGEKTGFLSYTAMKEILDEETRSRLIGEVERLLKDAYEHSKAILAANAATVSALVQRLLEHETLQEADIEDFWKAHPVHGIEEESASS